jgi:Ca2+-binding RTX toxin-like protein
MLSKRSRRLTSSASRKTGLCRSSRRPSLETLEDRRLLSVATAILGGQLIIAGDNTPNQITLDHHGSTTLVSWQAGTGTGSVSYADSDFNSISIQLGTAGDELTVAATPSGRKVSIENAGGLDTIHVGRRDLGVARDVLSGVSLISPSPVVLTIEDYADQIPQAIDLEDLTGGTGQILGLTAEPIQYQYSAVSRLEVFSGKDATVNVRQTGSPTHLFPSPSTGLTSVNLGDQGSLQEIRQRVGIESEGSLVDLTMSALHDPASPDFTISRYPVASGLDKITGLTPADMVYFDTQYMRTVVVQTSSAGANVNVQGLDAVTYLIGNGNNTVTVGDNGSLRRVNESLHVRNNSGTTALVVDASRDDYYFSQHVRIATVALDGFSNVVDGLWSKPLLFQGSTTRSLTVRGASGGATFTIPSTGAYPVTLATGAGDDLVSLGNDSDGLADLRGPLTIDGQGGNNSLILHDEANPAGQTFVVAPSSLSRGGRPDIAYAGIASLALNAGRGNDRIAVKGTPAGMALSLDGGAGANTLVGPAAGANWVLTAADAGQANSTAFGGPVVFSSMRNLVGGAGLDSFAFADGVLLTGTIDGGGGRNVLNYSAYRSNVLVNLALGRATGAAGVAHIQDVYGGQGSNLLVGDAQANLLVGNVGRDVLIGGGGADTLTGGLGENILIGGTTDYDRNQAALNAIWSSWQRTDLTYPARVNFLARGDRTHPPLNGLTVHDDGARTLLDGQGDMDWYFAGPTDVVNGLKRGEVVTRLPKQ